MPPNYKTFNNRVEEQNWQMSFSDKKEALYLIFQFN